MRDWKDGGGRWGWVGAMVGKQKKKKKKKEREAG